MVSRETCVSSSWTVQKYQIDHFVPSWCWEDYPRVRISPPSKANIIQAYCRSIAISHLQELFEADDDVAVVFIYCNYKAQHNVLQLMEALLKQLAHHRLSPSNVDLLQRKHKERGIRPSLDTLMTILKTEIETYSHVFIIIDALDECFPEQVRQEFLRRLESLTVVTPTKMMATSRYIPSIERAIHADTQLEITAMESDIRSHVEARILNNAMLARLITKAPSMEERVVRIVVERAQGMYVVVDCYHLCFDNPHRFLLAQLHMDSLADESSRNAILRALERLPEGFEGTYDDAMERINQQSPKRKHMAYRLLSWISYAFRPLSLLELRYALAVREGMTKMDEDDLDDEEFLISVCAGLVTVSEGSLQVGLVRESNICM